MQFWFDPSPERHIRTRRRRNRQRALNEQISDAPLADLSTFLALDNPLYEVEIREGKPFVEHEQEEPPRVEPVRAPMANRTL